ncbi:hypothetical protein PFISCL1PPCAC_28116, partial [Pristionchus fissidentatus]
SVHLVCCFSLQSTFSEIMGLQLLILLTILISLIKCERKFDEMQYISSSHGRRIFTPSLCCQWCGEAFEWKEFSYELGRCLWSPEGRKEEWGTETTRTELKIDHPPLVYHEQECCWFCGDRPGQYDYFKWGKLPHQGY